MTSFSSSLFRCVSHRRFPLPTSSAATLTVSSRKLSAESNAGGDGETNSVASGKSAGKSIEQIFRDPRVQSLLKLLAGRDISRVFKQRQLRKLAESEIRLMTDAELKEYTDRKLQEVDTHLQMPPVMEERKDCVEILETEPSLLQYDTHRHVFTDITYAVKPRKRYIVVREVDGTLRTASWAERDKMQQIYFPQPGRDLDMPKVFEEEFLREALDKGFYEYLLDRACVQFEPDDPHFIRVCRAIYSHINQQRSYHVLESSRHMGGLLFFLVYNNRIDDYLIYLLQNERIDDIKELLRLYRLVQSDDDSTIEDPVGAVREYIAASSRISQMKMAKLELALQAFLEKTRSNDGEIESNQPERSMRQSN